jgi:hypothetical protein
MARIEFRTPDMIHTMNNDNQIDCSGKPPLKYRVFVLLVIAACLLFWAVHWASVVNYSMFRSF